MKRSPAGLTLLCAAILAPIIRADAMSSDEANDPKLADARARVKVALAAMGSDDPQPYMDLWAETDDVTLFGAWGLIEKGHQSLMETFRWGVRSSDDVTGAQSSYCW
jgi:hypothetical protein